MVQLPEDVAKHLEVRRQDLPRWTAMKKEGRNTNRDSPGHAWRGYGSVRLAGTTHLAR